ncbi:MAG: Hsp20/alpha crystallin family protein [Thermoprotei archaeon]
MSEKSVLKKNGSTGRSTALAPTRTTTWPQSLDLIFDSFRRSVDDFFAPFVSAMPWLGFEGSMTARYPLVDVEDFGDHYVLTAELPGLSKESVDVRANAYGVEISAQTASDNSGSNRDYVYRERGYVSFNRTLSLPEEIVPDKIEASMQNGILHLNIPKKEPKPEARKVKVNIK